MLFAGARKFITGTGRSAGREKEHRNIDGEKVHDLAVSNSRVLAASSGPCRHWPTSLRGQGDKTRDGRDKIRSAVAGSRLGRDPRRGLAGLNTRLRALQCAPLQRTPWPRGG